MTHTGRQLRHQKVADGPSSRAFDRLGLCNMVGFELFKGPGAQLTTDDEFESPGFSALAFRAAMI